MLFGWHYAIFEVLKLFCLDRIVLTLGSLLLTFQIFTLILAKNQVLGVELNPESSVLQFFFCPFNRKTSL